LENLEQKSFLGLALTDLNIIFNFNSFPFLANYTFEIYFSNATFFFGASKDEKHLI